MTLTIALAMLPGLAVGLTLHEFAHAWTASLLGDDFARRQGRVSLNPFRHLSPLGTLALLILPFGWARPVPVNLYNFARPRRDYLLVSLAGPLANVLIVAACLGLMQLTRHSLRYHDLTAGLISIAHFLLMVTVVINMVLATINLIPIPPLDGSKIWPCILPGVKPATKPRTVWLSVILLIVLLQTGSLRPAIDFVLGGALRLMPASDSQLVAERALAADKALSEARWAEAEALYSEALAIYPRSAACLRGRAEARAEQGNSEGALADIDLAIDLHLSPDYYELRARILRRLGRDEEAAAAETKASSLKQAASEVPQAVQ